MNNELREALRWYRTSGYLAVEPPYRSHMQPIVEAARAMLNTHEVSSEEEESTATTTN